MNLTEKQITFINKLLVDKGKCYEGHHAQGIHRCSECILKLHGLPKDHCSSELALDIVVRMTNELSQKLYESREIQFYL